MTDVFGDIPYFESGNLLETRNFTPAYDSQQSIYTDLIKELREAKAAFNPDDIENPVRGDQFYQGDIPQWLKLANSLLLRIGMRLLKVDPGLAQNLINEAVDADGGGVMVDRGDMPVMEHTENEPNPFEFNLNDQHFFLHKTLVDHMKIKGDPGSTFMLPFTRKQEEQ